MGLVWTPWGLSRISWSTLRTDLLSPPSLLQNTDLFEMIEKMQVRLDPLPIPGSHRWGWAGGGGPCCISSLTPL